jgi:integrase
MRLISSGAATRAAAEAAWPGVRFVEPRTPNEKDAGAHEGLKIKTTLQFYWDRHASKLPSAQQASIAIRHLKNHFADAEVASLEDEEVQQDYVCARHLDGVAERTIDREISVLRASVRLYAEKHPGTPRRRIYHVALPPTHANWLNASDVRRLLDAVASPHLYLFILLMLATAGRPSAIFDLRWGQVDFRSRRIHLNPLGRVQTAKKRPTVPIDDKLLELLMIAYHARTCDYVIEYGGAPITSIKRAFRDAAARAGFAPGAVTPYTLRHTAATWMAQRGVSLWEIAGFLGHSDTRMVERTYAHHHPDFREKAKAAISAGDGHARRGVESDARAAGEAKRSGPVGRRRRAQPAPRATSPKTSPKNRPYS